MKVDAETEVAATNNVRTSAARIWLSEELSQQMEPLLSGLGIELLAAHDRKHATIRIESLAGGGRASSFTGGYESNAAKMAPMVRSNLKDQTSGLPRAASSRRPSAFFR